MTAVTLVAVADRRLIVSLMVHTVAEAALTGEQDSATARLHDDVLEVARTDPALVAAHGRHGRI